MAEVLARKIADGFHSKTVETTSKLKVGQQTASHENHRDGEAETTSYAQVHKMHNHLHYDHCFAKTNTHSPWNGI